MFLPVAVAAVSCQTETVESKGDSDIGFLTLTTRSAGIDTPADVAAADGFQVWGYRHSGNWPATVNRIIFDGTHVTSGDGGATWSYPGVRAVWPTRYNVSFFACAPAGVEGAVIDDSQTVPVIGFTVIGNPAFQKDLLIAQQMLNRRGPDPVEVALGHALSRISFSARKTPETVGNINVTRVELRDISYTGSAPMLMPVSWTVDSSIKYNYILTTADGLLTDTSPSITDDSWQTIATTAGTMFLMPQTLAPTAVMEVTFSYSSAVIDTEFTSLINLSEVWPIWEAGTPYNYRLLFDGEEVVVIGSTLEPAGSGNWGQY